jgi:cellulose synthase/poly-beta-1,6-N-acetylglucosamine synthase-like glycosyltransferase
MTWHALLVGTQWLFLAYFAALTVMYLALNVVSMRVVERDADARATSLLPRPFSGLEPPVTVIVPAYDEAATIAGAVRSALQLEYPRFEIVVVNDGSKDDTLAVLRREFALVPAAEEYRASLRTRPIRAVYRSLEHPNLKVVDKENGGKADALNAGIAVAGSPLFCAVDADCVLQRDSLHRVVRPFLEDRRVIACGGSIRVANGCRVSDGFLEEAAIPRSWLARIQVVEYLRAFLFGRMGWSPSNAMLVISGAFGVFRRSAVVEAGGYRTDTVGEDMELVTRLHRLHRAARKPYRIVFVPDPICWTEAPDSADVLRRQRVRWQRGLLESLAANWRLLFHARGGAPGWLAFPALLAFEVMGPVVEVAGYAVLFATSLLGWTSWRAFAAFTVLAFGIGTLLSVAALLLEERSFHVYRGRRDLAVLLAAVVLENLGLRQMTAWWRVCATGQWLLRRRGRWGAMPRSAAWQGAPRS